MRQARTRPDYYDRRILLAMREGPSADILMHHFKRQNIPVHRVMEGDAALDYLQQYKIDLVLAETHLPGVTGMELVRLLKPINLPVVLFGRKGNNEEIVRAFENGVADYITRPFAPEVTMARIIRRLRGAPKRQSTAPPLTVKAE